MFKMPKGKKHRFPEKADDIAKHIASEYRKKGYSRSKAKQIAWATVVSHHLGGVGKKKKRRKHR